jgi:AGZA family xanthine/uracil permease-like MFS transporter
MLVMPFAWSISNGIGAAFISYGAIKMLGGKGREVHGLLYLVAAAFVLYFASPAIEVALAK